MKSTVKLSRKEQAALEEAALVQLKKDKRKIKSYIPETWKKIESWGRDSGNLSQHLQTYCFTISGRVRKNAELEPLEVSNGIRILDIVAELAPELIVIEEATAPKGKQYEKLEVTIDVITQAVQWDKKNKILKSVSHAFMLDLAKNRRILTDQNKKIASWNIEIIQKCGFEYKHGLVKAVVEETVVEEEVKEVLEEAIA